MLIVTGQLMSLMGGGSEVGGGEGDRITKISLFLRASGRWAGVQLGGERHHWMANSKAWEERGKPASEGRVTSDLMGTC